MKMKTTQANKELINRYLRESIKQYFGQQMDLSGEYTFAENLVSKKIIIAPTFTEQILADPELKMFLTSLINELNYEKCSIDFIKEKFSHHTESASEEEEMETSV